MRIINSIKGLILLISSSRIFKPEEILKDKRVAVIGAADSAFECQNGDYIDNFDLIVRVNKAPHSWHPKKSKYIGSRTDILFHSFYENTESGGGPIDFELYAKHGIKYVVNPNFSIKGLRTHLTYFKRNLDKKRTFLLPRQFYKKMTANFGEVIPTVGYSALYTVLNSNCKEVFITGFTFFKTPYANDYRDHLKDMETNKGHLKSQGLHDPDLELIEFIKQKDIIEKKSSTKIILDDSLRNIVEQHS
ncbi:glycosyltransferase family 29 protein [Salegentibacter mishustinae]|uniref:glycosyltransferase family 29 protein n=1 Tax=Salegentibacter mishustinae TaxID=270918 RepID=UPI001CE02BA9|nr:glycosyltransferase family 29 protein [Salegentibacter mishustinae]UBZ06855.1 glycosyltransferase family 29 protein [Salegentibacter mishustinae]